MQDQSLDAKAQKVDLPDENKHIKDDLNLALIAYTSSGEQDYVSEFFPYFHREIISQGSFSTDFEYWSM